MKYLIREHGLSVTLSIRNTYNKKDIEEILKTCIKKREIKHIS